MKSNQWFNPCCLAQVKCFVLAIDHWLAHGKADTQESEHLCTHDKQFLSSLFLVPKPHKTLDGTSPLLLFFSLYLTHLLRHWHSFPIFFSTPLALIWHCPELSGTETLAWLEISILDPICIVCKQLVLDIFASQ